MIGDRWMVKGEMVKGEKGVRCMVKLMVKVEVYCSGV